MSIELNDADRAALWRAYTLWEEGDDFGEHMGAAVERIIAARIEQARVGEGALRERVEALHPVTEYRPCGRRIAEHPNPPPGPPSPPRGCARAADGHPEDECRTYDGHLLRLFARAETPIIETEPRVFYDCQTCPREQQDRTRPAPCPTLAALTDTAGDPS